MIIVSHQARKKKKSQFYFIVNLNSQDEMYRIFSHATPKWKYNNEEKIFTVTDILPDKYYIVYIIYNRANSWLEEIISPCISRTFISPINFSFTLPFSSSFFDTIVLPILFLYFLIDFTQPGKQINYH